MAKNTLQNKSESELVKKLAEKREELRELRFGMSKTTTRDTSTRKKARRDIARIATALNNKG